MPALSSSPVVAFIGISDRDRARRFYADTLGIRLVSEDDFAMVFDAGGTMLRVTPVGKPVVAGYTVLGWAVSNIDATVTELSGRGVTFERFAGLAQDENGVWAAPGGAKVAWFKDPDGNVLSVSQH